LAISSPIVGCRSPLIGNIVHESCETPTKLCTQIYFAAIVQQSYFDSLTTHGQGVA